MAPILFAALVGGLLALKGKQYQKFAGGVFWFYASVMCFVLAKYVVIRF